MPNKLNKIDRLILLELQHNARISNAELAERVNLSPTPCLRRLRKLEQSGLIKNYTAHLDNKALGLEISAFVFIQLTRNTLEQGKAFEDATRDMPEVMECCVVAGRNDYVLRVMTRDLEEFERFLKQQLASIEAVSSVESMIVLKQAMQRSALPL